MQTLLAWPSWIEPLGTVLLASALLILMIVAWGTNLIGLPGNWFGVAMLALYAWIGPADSRAAISYTAVTAAFAVALIGELIEFVAGAAGAKRAGASRRATVFAVVGSIVGAVSGAIVGIPVPVLGPLLAAILFGGLGAAAGAMYAEWTDGRPWRESWTIGQAAFWGRTVGVIGKFGVGLVIVAIAIGGVLI